MKNNSKFITIIYLLALSLYGFSSFRCKSTYRSIVNHPVIEDTSLIIDKSKLDDGFNKDISIQGDSTYSIFKDQLKWQPGVAMEILKLRSLNASIVIKFTSNHEIERIQYASLLATGNEDKNFFINKNYQTNFYQFKIGDSLETILNKLKGIRYKIEQNFPSTKDICITINGFIKNTGTSSVGEFDEYRCAYCFKKGKLDLVEINYFRDVTFKN
ncbi:MAG TPA: hypothetical protein PKU77_00870 [Ferruginibacter sp.]|nr:hypothetical protein [Ferruginibacter sp.]